MLGNLLVTIVKALFPGAPAWFLEVLVDAIPAVVELVRELDKDDSVRGHEKFERVSRATREAFDAAFDDVLEWSAYPEAGRDRILDGLVELAVFISRVARPDDPRRARRARQAFRRAARGVAA